MSSEIDISTTKIQLKFSYQHCVVKQRQQSSRTTIQFSNNHMSSEIDTSIHVCLLVNVKEGGPLGLGMWGAYIYIFFKLYFLF